MSCLMRSILFTPQRSRRGIMLLLVLFMLIVMLVLLVLLWLPLLIWML